MNNKTREISMTFNIGHTRNETCSHELGEQIAWAIYDKINKLKEHGEVVRLTIHGSEDQHLISIKS